MEDVGGGGSVPRARGGTAEDIARGYGRRLDRLLLLSLAFSCGLPALCGAAWAAGLIDLI